MSKFAILSNTVSPEIVEITSNLYLSVFKLVLFGMLSNNSTNANYDLSSKEVSKSLTEYYIKVKEINKDFKEFYTLKNVKKMDKTLFSNALMNQTADVVTVNKISEFLSTKKIDISKFKNKKNINDVVNMTIFLTNALMISSCEYSPDIVSSVLQDRFINTPQWWVIAVKGNFSMKSIKHSINTVHTTANNSKAVKAYLVNGAAALCPTNLTLGFIIDILGKNRPLNKIMIPKIVDSFRGVEANIEGMVESKNLHNFDKYNLFFSALNSLDLHMKATAVSGFTGFLNPYQFNHAYFFFWRYNAMNLRNSVFTTAFLQKKNANNAALITKYITKGDK